MIDLQNTFGEVKTSPAYFYLAKGALWVTSIVLTGVLVSCLARFVIDHDTKAISSIISSAQALSVIAISVMGYHLSGKHKFAGPPGPPGPPGPQGPAAE